MKAIWPIAIVLVAGLATGCAESATLAGNGASMLVATALLWSTVNINRRRDDEGA